jgi:hypothetical protein
MVEGLRDSVMIYNQQRTHKNKTHDGAHQVFYFYVLTQIRMGNLKVHWSKTIKINSTTW